MLIVHQELSCVLNNQGTNMKPICKSIVTYTAEELAAILCISRNTIYQQRRKGLLPNGLKYGSRRLWKHEELAGHSSQLNAIFGSHN
jgi:hypothetical protein